LYSMLLVDSSCSVCVYVCVSVYTTLAHLRRVHTVITRSSSDADICLDDEQTTTTTSVRFLV